MEMIFYDSNMVVHVYMTKVSIRATHGVDAIQYYPDFAHLEWRAPEIPVSDGAAPPPICVPADRLVDRALVCKLQHPKWRTLHKVFASTCLEIRCVL